MIFVANAEVVSNIHLPSGKKYLALSEFRNFDADDFTTLAGGPWFDTEVLSVDVLIDQYSFEGYLPGEIQLEWTRNWCWRNQCACSDAYLACSRNKGLVLAHHHFC